MDDEPDIRQGIEMSMKGFGYAVDIAEDGEVAIHKATEVDYDAIVLDVMLPKVDGWEVLRRIRSLKDTPVLMLTARDEILDRIKGLDLGSDDYVVKPFDLDELLARIRAIVRRRAGHASSHLSFGHIRMDMGLKRVYCNEGPVILTPREFALVEFLALRRDQVVSRTELYDHLFDDEDESLSNLLDVHVCNIRKKLGKNFIITRRGLGYSINREGRMRFLPRSIRWRIQFWHGVLLSVITVGLLYGFYRFERRMQLGRLESRLMMIYYRSLPILSQKVVHGVRSGRPPMRAHRPPPRPRGKSSRSGVAFSKVGRLLSTNHRLRSLQCGVE